MEELLAEIKQLKESERGAKALRGFIKFRLDLWSLDTKNQHAIIALIRAQFTRAGTLTHALLEDDAE